MPTRAEAAHETTQLSLEPRIEPHNRLADLILFLHAHKDSFASVQHRSMIPSPEGFSNFMQGGLGVPPEVKEPVLLHAPTRKRVGYFGAVRLRDGKFIYAREEDKFKGQSCWQFFKQLRQRSYLGRHV